MTEPIAESKHKKKGTKIDNKVMLVEREGERDPEVKMMVRTRWTKEENKLVMRYFYHIDSSGRQYLKRMIAIWREI